MPIGVFVWAKRKTCGHGDPPGRCRLAYKHQKGVCDYQPEWFPAFDDGGRYLEGMGTDEGYKRDELVFGPIIPTYHGEAHDDGN